MDIQTLIRLSNENLSTHNEYPWTFDGNNLEDLTSVVAYLEGKGFTREDISVIRRPEENYNSEKMTTWVAVRVKTEGDFFLNAKGKRVTGANRNYVALSTLARRVQKGEKLSFGGNF